MPGFRHGRHGRWQEQGFSRRAVRMLEPTLLLLLHHDRSHGYTLLEQLQFYGLGGLHPSVVYRNLREMEQRGLIISVWDEKASQGPPRRVYRLTEAGNEVLALWVKDLQETKHHIDRLLSAYDRHMDEGSGEHH
jgi:DNA-binding PadR family transcriptional regulator